MRAGRAAARRAVSARRAARRGACCWSTSSTTSCPAARSPRSTSGRGPTWPPSRTRADALAGSALAALGATATRPSRSTRRPFARREVARDPAGALVVVEAPAYGRRGGGRHARRRALERIADGGVVLENEHLRATLTAGGELASLVHRASGREALAAPGNRPRALRGPPRRVRRVGHRSRRTSRRAPTARRRTSIAAVTAEPAARRGRLRASRRPRVAPAPDVPPRRRRARRLEVHTTADWHEDHRLLKVAFPLAVRADEATYEMAFGVAGAPDALLHARGPRALRGARPPLRRPLRARLRRRAAHRLQVRLQRVRRRPCASACCARPRRPTPTPTWASTPSPTPSSPTPAAGRTAAWSARRARSTRRCAGARACRPAPWAQVDAPGLVLDTIKLAEDSDALVLRLYEAHGGRGRARIRARAPVDGGAPRQPARGSTLGLAEVDGDAIVVDYRPWEIVTLVVD